MESENFPLVLTELHARVAQKQTSPLCMKVGAATLVRFRGHMLLEKLDPLRLSIQQK